MPLHGLIEIPELPPGRGPEDLLVVVKPGAMDDVLIADADCRVPRRRRHLEQAIVRPHGVEQAPVVELLEEIVEILGVKDGSTALRTLAKPESSSLLHLGDEIPL